MPLFVPRGSVILWLSSTLHSAQTQSPPGTVQLEDSPWADWRCVVYGAFPRLVALPSCPAHFLGTMLCAAYQHPVGGLKLIVRPPPSSESSSTHA